MADKDEEESLVNEDNEQVSFADKAIIIGLEEIIDELKEVNEKLSFNNNNISLLRDELDELREENIENQNQLMKNIGGVSGASNHTILAHLNGIRETLFGALVVIPIIAIILLVIISSV